MRERWRTKSNGILLNIVPIVFDPLFSRLFKADELFANPDGTEFSVKKIFVQKGDGTTVEFFNYTEGLRKKFPGYELDKNNVIYNVSDKEINLDDHWKLLLTDFNEKLYNEKIADDSFGRTQAKFLSKGLSDAISYTSYPRSGNTMLRKYLENITGIATGSDQIMKFTLNVSLQYQGFKGESVVQDRTWINKTHYPWRTVLDIPYSS
jgi:hypothetical protein